MEKKRSITFIPAPRRASDVPEHSEPPTLEGAEAVAQGLSSGEGYSEKSGAKVGLEPELPLHHRRGTSPHARRSLVRHDSRPPDECPLLSTVLAQLRATDARRDSSDSAVDVLDSGNSTIKPRTETTPMDHPLLPAHRLSRASSCTQDLIAIAWNAFRHATLPGAVSAVEAQEKLRGMSETDVREAARHMLEILWQLSARHPDHLGSTASGEVGLFSARDSLSNTLTGRRDLHFLLNPRSRRESQAPALFMAARYSIERHIPISSIADLRRLSMLEEPIAGEEDVVGTLNQYELCSVLGSGAEGVVYLAHDREKGEFRAIKEVKRPLPGSALDRRLKNQISIMQHVQHRNLIQLREVIDDPNAKHFYMVMQLAEFGSLLTATEVGGDEATHSCRPMCPDRFLKYALQISAGLSFMHKRGIVHGDVKPMNVLLGTNDQVYLGDFGSARVEADEEAGGAAADRGTPYFFPPEVLARGSATAPRHDAGQTLRAADAWALGVTFYVFLCGRLPVWELPLGVDGTSGVLLPRVPTFAMEHSEHPPTIGPSGSHAEEPPHPQASSMGPLFEAFRWSVLHGKLAFAVSLPQAWKRVVEGLLDKDPATRLKVQQAKALLKELDSSGPAITRVVAISRESAPAPSDPAQADSISSVSSSAHGSEGDGGKGRPAADDVRRLPPTAPPTKHPPRPPSPPRSGTSPRRMAPPP